MSDRRVLMVGAGPCQLEVIVRARRMGYTVVAVDRDPDAPGLVYADFPEVVSVKDERRVVEVAKAYDVQGVLTAQGDAGVLAVGAVVDALGLLGIGRVAALAISDKRIAKMFLEEHGIPTPRAFDDPLESVEFPVIVKPCDGVGSKGVYRAENEEELQKFAALAKRESRYDEVLIEECISGVVVNVDLMMQNGEPRYVFYHDEHEASGNRFGIDVYTCPTKFAGTPVEEQILAQSLKALQAFNVRDGCVAVEVIVDDQGRVFVLEINPRMSGELYIENHVWFTGVDWHGDAVKTVMGDRVTSRSFDHSAIRPHAWALLGAKRSGVIRRLDVPENFEQVYGVRFARFCKSVGDTVEAYRSAYDVVAYITCEGESLQQAMAYALDARRAIVLDVE